MKRIILFIFGVSILLLNISCSPHVIKDDELIDVKNKPHGTLQFLLNDPYDEYNESKINITSTEPKSWGVDIIVNGLKYITAYDFDYGKELSFPVPAGDIVIEYKLYSRKSIYLLKKFVEGKRIENIVYRTGNSKSDFVLSINYEYSAKRKLRLHIEPGESKRLAITNLGEKEVGDQVISATYISWTVPAFFQEVCLKLEDK